MDRELYRTTMHNTLKGLPLDIISAGVEDLIVKEENGISTVKGVVTADGREIHADAVVITTGTFLRGEMYIGLFFITLSKRER